MAETQEQTMTDQEKFIEMMKDYPEELEQFMED